MRIGCQINTWKSDDVAAVIAEMGRAGLDGIETFTSHLKPYYDEPEKFRSILDAGGLRLSGAYFFSEGFIDPAAEDSAVTEAAAACRFLGAVGGDYLIANGGVGKGDPPRVFGDGDFARFAKVLNRIGAAAADAGAGAVVHPHQKCMVETPDDVDRLLAAGVDRRLVGLCVHAAHQLSVGADPYEIYEKHAALVRYAHIGNSLRGKGSFIGEGDLDQLRLMRPLLETGFDGWIVIECGQEGVSPADYARNAMAYIESTWPEMKRQK